MLLFTPGPTAVPEFVRAAMSGETLHHRTPEFEAIFKRARELLFKLFKMDEVVMLSSSGTGAMEATIINLVQKKVLTVNAGKFGERFGKIAISHGLENIELKYEWDTPARVEDIESLVREHKDIDALAIQVSESAGGLRHPVEAIAKRVKEINPKIVVIADGITAVGVEQIETTDIDVLIAGSQKAMMLPPGLSMIGLSGFAVERISEGRGYYFNLASEIEKQRKNTTAYTAPTTLIVGLVAVLEKIDGIGLDKFYIKTARRAEAINEAVEAVGFAIYPKAPAKSMSSIKDSDANAIRKILKDEFGVNVAGGQDHLKGKIFRINQMGLIEDYEAAWVVNALEMALHRLGRREYDGTASRVYSKKLLG